MTPAKDQRLFVVYLGGRLGDCHIELHDIRFVVGKTLEDTIPTLLKEWIGDNKGVHLDAYAELKEADGYRLSLTDKPGPQEKKLYFVNLGGYDENKFTELHEVGFFVASHASEAKRKAKRLLLRKASMQHQDDLFDVDDCLAVERVGGLYVQLTPLTQKKPWSPLKPDWYGYNVIGR